MRRSNETEDLIFDGRTGLDFKMKNDKRERKKVEGEDGGVAG